MRRRLFLLAALLVYALSPGLLVAAGDEWEAAISAFEARDRENMPEPGVIVFVGSSSIRGWESLAGDFAPLEVVNRGFGGSQIEDAVRYADRIVIPYKPSRVVLYSGDNDIWAGKTPGTVAADFRKFVAKVRTALPAVPVYFIAIKPSISRWSAWPKMKKANELVKEFAAETPGVEYIDIAAPMLGADSKPRPELFADDGLHLNEAGYELWTSVVKPYLTEQAGSGAR